MEITLEAVEKVMAEAEVEFAEAKAALIGADGNAEAAIEAIKASRAAVEEAADEVQDLGAKGDTFEDVFNRTVEKATAGAEKAAEQTKAKTDEIVAKVKKAVQDGNVDRIVVKRNDEVLLNIPVNVGIVGGLIGLTAAPFAMIAAAAAAYGFSCKFEIVKKDGSVTEINEKAEAVVRTVADKAKEVYGAVSAKVEETVKTAGEEAEEVTEEAEEVCEKAEEACEETAAKIEDEVANEKPEE